MINLATGEIAPEDMWKELSSSGKREEDAPKEFFDRYTKVRVIITAAKTYYDSITKQYSTIFLPEKQNKKEFVIPGYEGQSFVKIPAKFDDKKLYLKLVIDWWVIKNPWAICNENGKTTNNFACRLPQTWWIQHEQRASC